MAAGTRKDIAMRAGPRLLVAGLSAVALLAVGCGRSTSNVAANASPQQQLAAAVQQLGAGSVVTVTAQVTGATTPPASDRMGRLLAGSLFTAEALNPSGGSLSSLKGLPDVSLALTNGSQAFGELRVVAGALYVRVDVPALAAGQKLGKNELPRQLPLHSAWVQAALAGRWVTIPAAALSAVAGQFGGTAMLDNGALTRFEAILHQASTVTSAGSGHYIVTLNTMALRSGLASLNPMARMHAPDVPQANAVRTVRVDAYVTGGVLSKVTFDLSQLPAAKGHQPKGVMTLTFVQSGPAIVAPSGATMVNLSDLAPLFGRLMSGAH